MDKLKLYLFLILISHLSNVAVPFPHGLFLHINLNVFVGYLTGSFTSSFLSSADFTRIQATFSNALTSLEVNVKLILLSFSFKTSPFPFIFSVYSSIFIMLGAYLVVFSLYYAYAATTCETILEKLTKDIAPIFMEEFANMQIKPNEAQVNLIVTSIILQKAKIDPPTVENCVVSKQFPCEIVCTAGGRAEIEFQAFSYQYKGTIKMQNIATKITYSSKGKPNKVEITFPTNPDDAKFEIEDSWIFNQIAQYLSYLYDFAKPHGEHEILKFLKRAYNKKTEL